MSSQGKRDIEKVYSTAEFVAKLRRLADALEAGTAFEIQVAGERLYVPASAALSHSSGPSRSRSSICARAGAAACRLRH